MSKDTSSNYVASSVYGPESKYFDDPCASPYKWVKGRYIKTEFRGVRIASQTQQDFVQFAEVSNVLADNFECSVFADENQPYFNPGYYYNITAEGKRIPIRPICSFLLDPNIRHVFEEAVQIYNVGNQTRVSPFYAFVYTVPDTSPLSLTYSFGSFFNFGRPGGLFSPENYFQPYQQALVRSILHDQFEPRFNIRYTEIENAEQANLRFVNTPLNVGGQTTYGITSNILAINTPQINDPESPWRILHEIIHTHGPSANNHQHDCEDNGKKRTMDVSASSYNDGNCYERGSSRDFVQYMAAYVRRSPFDPIKPLTTLRPLDTKILEDDYGRNPNYNGSLGYIPAPNTTLGIDISKTGTECLDGNALAPVIMFASSPILLQAGIGMFLGATNLVDKIPVVGKPFKMLTVGGDVAPQGTGIMNRLGRMGRDGAVMLTRYAIPEVALINDFTACLTNNLEQAWKDCRENKEHPAKALGKFVTSGLFDAGKCVLPNYLAYRTGYPILFAAFVNESSYTPKQAEPEPEAKDAQDAPPAPRQSACEKFSGFLGGIVWGIARNIRMVRHVTTPLAPKPEHSAAAPQVLSGVIIEEVKDDVKDNAVASPTAASAASLPTASPASELKELNQRDISTSKDASVVAKVIEMVELKEGKAAAEKLKEDTTLQKILNRASPPPPPSIPLPAASHASAVEDSRGNSGGICAVM